MVPALTPDSPVVRAQRVGDAYLRTGVRRWHRSVARRIWMGGRSQMVSEIGRDGYEVVEGFFKRPKGWTFVEVADVGIDGDDNVFVFCRGTHPVMIFDKEGRFLDAWGKTGESHIFTSPTAPAWRRAASAITPTIPTLSSPSSPPAAPPVRTPAS